MRQITLADFKTKKYFHPCGEKNSLTNNLFLNLLEKYTDGIYYLDGEDPTTPQDPYEICSMDTNIINVDKLTVKDINLYKKALNKSFGYTSDEFDDMIEDYDGTDACLQNPCYLNDGTTVAQVVIENLLLLSCGMRVETFKDKKPMNVHNNFVGQIPMTNTFFESE